MIASNCSRNYIICARGKAIAFKCPDGLMFNNEMVTCDYPSNIKGCDDFIDDKIFSQVIR